MSSKSVVSTVAGVGLSCVGLAILASTEPPSAEWRSADELPAFDAMSLPALAQEVKSLNSRLQATKVANAAASREVWDFQARLSKASAAVAHLPSEIEALKQQATTLKAAIRQAVEDREAVTQDLAEYAKRFHDFQAHAPSYQQIDCAERALDGGKLTTLEEAYWRELPEAKRSALKYVRSQRTFITNKKKLAAEVASADHHYRALNEKWAGVLRQHADATARLAEVRIELAEVPAQLAAAEAGLTEQSNAQEAIQQRLAVAKRVQSRRYAEAKKAAERRLLATEQRGRQEAQASSPAVAFAPAAADSVVNVAVVPLYERRVIAYESDERIYRANALPPWSPRDEHYDRIHIDGRGLTSVRGNQTLVQRADGPSSMYTRDGNWEWHQMSHGVHGVRYYDDFRGVAQFDYVNPYSMVRTLGEQPYFGNDYGQGWSVQAPAW